MKGRPHITPAYLDLVSLSVYSGLSVATLRACLNDASCPLPHFRTRGRGKVLVKCEDFDIWISRWRSEGSAKARVEEILAEVCNQMQPASGQRH